MEVRASDWKAHLKICGTHEGSSDMRQRMSKKNRKKAEKEKKLQAKKNQMNVDSKNKKKRGSSFKVGKDGKKVKTKLTTLTKAKAS
ncbi:hypothetical protein V2J09_000154 [Rumex salicifolius]